MLFLMKYLADSLTGWDSEKDTHGYGKVPAIALKG